MGTLGFMICVALVRAIVCRHVLYGVYGCFLCVLVSDAKARPAFWELCTLFFVLAWIYQYGCLWPPCYRVLSF